MNRKTILQTAAGLLLLTVLPGMPGTPGPGTPAAEESSAPPSGTYTVEKGDTLYSLSRRFNVSIRDLQERNGLAGTEIHAGTQLVIPGLSPDPSADPAGAASLRELPTETTQLNLTDYQTDRPEGWYYRVRPGDTLYSLSRRFDLPVEKLKAQNGLTGGTSSQDLAVGRRLLIKPRPDTGTGDKPAPESRGDPPQADPQADPQESPRPTPRPTPRGYREKTLAARAGTPDEPAQTPLLNSLLSTVRTPKGESGKSGENEDTGAPDQTWSAWNPPEKSPDLPPARRGYYYSAPLRRTQISRNYGEDPSDPAGVLHRRASRIWSAWRAEIREKPPLSRDLQGWDIVLDPGHGGSDPGAVTVSFTGDGRPVYVVEDEYAYDITLRTAALLMRHGARVELTVLSPNHTTRTTDPPSVTLVNEKNEVYNHPEYGPRDIVRGGTQAVRERAGIVGSLFTAMENRDTRHRLLLSIHADNSPQASSGRRIFYRKKGNREDRGSRRFGRSMAAVLGTDTAVLGEEMAVLRGDLMAAAASGSGLRKDLRESRPSALLVEIRNLARQDHSRAIRDSRIRQQDAADLAAAVLHAAGKTGKTGRADADVQ